MFGWRVKVKRNHGSIRWLVGVWPHALRIWCGPITIMIWNFDRGMAAGVYN